VPVWIVQSFNHRLEPGGPVPVHLLRLQHICPRLAYLSARREDAPPVEVLAARELSLSIPGFTGELEEYLRQRWDMLPVELPAIHPQLERGEVESALSEMEAGAVGLFTAWGEWARGDTCAAALSMTVDRDVYLTSRRFELVGRLDVLAEYRGRPVPVVARGGAFPSRGVFGGDRASLAAYAMLLENADREFRGSGQVEEGWVINFNAGELRRARLSARDRRRVWHLVRGLKSIARGELPGIHRGKQCDKCTVRERCGSDWRTLDEMF